jgi:8-oxo-dGTP pyrophosphatase MutT (NUDIX family)
MPAGQGRLRGPAIVGRVACGERAVHRLVHDGQMPIKHATASTFVFGRLPGGWRLGLILHPIFGRLMIPGGHVEPDESAPEAADREVAEETGLKVSFVPAPTAAVPPGLATARRLVSPPWWIIEQPVERDNHLAEPHFHLDHLYVAVADQAEPVTEPAHAFGWYDLAGMRDLHMFGDTRLLAATLFADIETIGLASAVGPGHARQPPRRGHAPVPPSPTAVDSQAL